MSAIVYGSKYEADLDKAEIAKRIRADIKSAIQTGALPKGLKTSVRLRRFAGGSAIDVEITAVPPDFVILNPERLAYERQNPHQYLPALPDHPLSIYTPEYTALAEKLKAIWSAYNYDGSDMSSDYFNVNYYGNVGVDWRLEKAEREAFADRCRILGVYEQLRSMA